MSCKTHVKCVKRAGIRLGIRIPPYHRSQSSRNWREINACQILVNNLEVSSKMSNLNYRNYGR